MNRAQNDHLGMAEEHTLQRGGLQLLARNSAIVHGSQPRTRETQDNLQAQFNAIEAADREVSMPGSGNDGYDAVDDFSNAGLQSSIQFNVNLDASYDDFLNHMDFANTNFKGQVMQKVRVMAQKEINMLAKKVSKTSI